MDIDFIVFIQGINLYFIRCTLIYDDAKLFSWVYALNAFVKLINLFWVVKRFDWQEEY